MLKKLPLLILLFIISLPAQNDLRTQNIGNLKLTGGGVIKNCIVAYRVWGKANADSSNIVIYPTWFAGSSENLKGLLGKGRIVDTADYCVIGLDALSDGFSSSPSNTKLPAGEKFPDISVKDMVNSQYILLTKFLGIRKIHAVIGGSMGGMQTFEWLASYPGFMKKAVPYVGTPRPSLTDLVIWRNQVDMIEMAERCGLPPEEAMRAPNQVMHLFAYTHKYRNEKTPRENLEEYYNSHRKINAPTFTPDNYKSQVKAMIKHDIYNGGKPEEFAPKIKANVFVIVASTDNLVYHGPAVELAKLINAKLHISDSYIGHIFVGNELSTLSPMIDAFLKE